MEGMDEVGQLQTPWAGVWSETLRNCDCRVAEEAPRRVLLHPVPMRQERRGIDYGRWGEGLEITRTQVFIGGFLPVGWLTTPLPAASTDSATFPMVIPL